VVLDATALLGSDPSTAGPLDIDVHAIPANRSKREGKHYHFDLRYAFRLPAAAEVTLQWEEVSGFQWTPIDEIRSPRIAAKLGGALRRHATARTGAGSAQPPVPRDRSRIGEARHLVDDDA
jgi:hypothetical protein